MIPHKTLSYVCSGDPSDAASEPPFCVLKSFPFAHSHAVSWARRKVTNLAVAKPREAKKFLEEGAETREALCQALKEGTDEWDFFCFKGKQFDCYKS